MELIKKGEKIQYLNLIKAISIFLVVFCHIVILKFDGVIDNICMLICWIAVPCFFLVNGAILLNKKLDLKKHYKKVLIIYLVNVVWRLIYLIIYVFFLNLNLNSISKIEIFKYLFLFQNLNPINISHFYFIEIILAIYLIFPIIHTCYNSGKEGKRNLFLVIITIFLFTYFINAINFFGKYIIKDSRISLDGLNKIFIFGNYAKFLVYFVLGGFLHLYKDKIHNIKKINLICIIAIIISLMMLILEKYIINKTFAWKGIYLQNGYDKISTFAMSISFFILLQNLNFKNKIVSTIIDEIGTSTLGIFYIHIPILVLLKEYLYDYIVYKGVLINFIKTIVVIIISYIIIKILRKIPVLKKIVS